MKYTYKPYNPLYPTLFEKEKERLLSRIKNQIIIEHVGSTAVPGLGGKEIIDIAIAANATEVPSIAEQLQTLGYEYRPFFDTPEHLYFVIDLDFRYHVHLTHQKSKAWLEMIHFRDVLRNDPEALQKYSELKKAASLSANQDGKVYRALKEPFIEKINRRTKNG